MYAPFFGLTQEPFSIAPDPRFLYMSERHREALAHLLYGLGGGGGFVLLTGEVGAGKTTVCRCFLEQVPRRCNVAYIFNPKLTVPELLKTVCDEFHIPVGHDGGGSPTVKDYVDPLNQFLLKTHAVGQNNLLVIDEAQMLSVDVLEQLRLLTNLETNERKLLQIVLIGQPELRTLLARPELEQLAQRVTARFHLGALSEAETAQYIAHRMAVGGRSSGLPFDAKALARIHQLSRGVPRRINLLCDRSLLGAYATGLTSIDRGIVEQAAREVFGDAAARRGARTDGGARKVALGAAAAVLAGAAGFGLASWLAGPGAGGGSKTLAAAGSAAAAGATTGAASSARASASAFPSRTATSSVNAASAGASTASAPAAITAAADVGPLWRSAARDEQTAWRELAAAWQTTLAEGDACAAAQRVLLNCFRSPSSTLALIRQLGRPGILTLRDASGQPAWALLTGLTDGTATLQSAGSIRTVPLAALAAVWQGDFETFWRAPPGYAGLTGPGATGPVVDRIATQLATFDGKPIPPAGQPYDAALKARVHAFQLAQGLKPDGRAGPTTFMQLNRASGVDEPRLAGAPPVAQAQAQAQTRAPAPPTMPTPVRVPTPATGDAPAH
jgi:general secretion pathway protein A